MWTDTEAVRQSSSRSKVVAEVKNILEMRLYSRDRLGKSGKQ